MSTNGVDRYGVMGYPISHSRSPVIHRLFALQTEQSMQYESLRVPSDELDVAVKHFEYCGGKGLNITLPHKHDVLRLTDHVSNRASVAGAVNLDSVPISCTTMSPVPAPHTAENAMPVLIPQVDSSTSISAFISVCALASGEMPSDSH